LEHLQPLFDLIYWLLAQRAWILTISDPCFYAFITVIMAALVKSSFIWRFYLIEAYGTGATLFGFTHALEWMSVLRNGLDHESLAFVDIYFRLLAFFFCHNHWSISLFCSFFTYFWLNLWLQRNFFNLIEYALVVRNVVVCCRDVVLTWGKLLAYWLCLGSNWLLNNRLSSSGSSLLTEGHFLI
jgi:hypothetical protein